MNVNCNFSMYYISMYKIHRERKRKPIFFCLVDNQTETFLNISVLNQIKKCTIGFILNIRYLAHYSTSDYLCSIGIHK